MKDFNKFQKSLALSIALFLIGAAACTSSANSNISVNTTNSTVNSVASANANGNIIGAAESSNSDAPKTSPDTIVADLYKQHDAENSPFFQDKNRALVDKYFAKLLADMIWKDITTTKPGEEGALGFDPLYNAQDMEIKNFKIGQADIKDKSAKVPVTFVNFGKKQMIIFLLVQENGSWKIQNIDYGKNMTLAGIYKENAALDTVKKEDTSLTGEFAGEYQVGETTCTVKPIKMAFEVKWEKGTGTEIFFSQGTANDKYVFASDPKTGKANTFSFDDENYNTGTFHRADGKEFPIKRVK